MGLHDQSAHVHKEHNNRRNAKRMGPNRFDDRPAGQVRHRVPQPTARTEQHPEDIERAKRDKMRARRIHTRHRRETNSPYHGLHHPGAMNPSQKLVEGDLVTHGREGKP